MIHVTRLNGSTFYLNPDLICTLEETPDTVISMTTGDKFVVKERAQEVADRFVQFKQVISH